MTQAKRHNYNIQLFAGLLASSDSADPGSDKERGDAILSHRLLQMTMDPKSLITSEMSVQHGVGWLMKYVFEIVGTSTLW